MTIENLYTTQTQTSISAQAKGTGKLAGVPVGNIQGLNFIELIIANSTENPTETTETKKPHSENHQLLQSDNPVPAKDSKLDIAGLLAETPEIEEEVKAFALDAKAALPETLVLNQKALDDVLKSIAEDNIIANAALITPAPELHNIINEISEIKVTGIEEAIAEIEALISSAETFAGEINGETESTDSADGASALVKLNHILQILQKIQTLAGDDEGKNLIVSSYTPQQLTELKQKIYKSLTLTSDIIKNMAEPVNGFAQGIQAGLPKANSGRMPGSDLTSQLSSLVAGDSEARIFGGLPEPDLDGESFEQIIKQLSGKKGDSGTANLQNSMKNTSEIKPGPSALQGWPFNLTGSIFTPDGWTQGLLDEFGISGQGYSVTSPGNLTNLVTQAHSASYPHPATQMVAATIQKSAQGGENKNITLQLDPPELGKVEVRMSFGKDKTLKALILTEKPETYIMMQRDAHVLERALQEAGLNADGSSLSFEMAGGDHDFNHNGSHDGSGSGNSSGNNNSDGGEEIIETTMNWRIDLETGHMRYNILA